MAGVRVWMKPSGSTPSSRQRRAKASTLKGATWLPKRSSQAFQIDGRLLAGMLHHPIDGFLIHDNGKQAVLQAVGGEDVGDLSGDHGAEAEIGQRPGRMLAR